MIRYYSSITALAVVAQLTITSAAATAVKHTIGERLQEVGSQLNNAELRGTLSVNEVEALRQEKMTISSQEAKTLKDNGGFLSYEDIDRFESDLNNLSKKIQSQTVQSTK